MYVRWIIAATNSPGDLPTDWGSARCPTVADTMSFMAAEKLFLFAISKYLFRAVPEIVE